MINGIPVVQKRNTVFAVPDRGVWTRKYTEIRRKGFDELMTARVFFKILSRI